MDKKLQILICSSTCKVERIIHLCIRKPTLRKAHRLKSTFKKPAPSKAGFLYFDQDISLHNS